MFANKIIIWAFKQSPEVHYAVPVYKYLMQMEKNGPWNFGHVAEIFQGGEDNFSSSYLIHLQKAIRNIERREKLCFSSSLL